jgi:hypothetical protein
VPRTGIAPCPACGELTITASLDGAHVTLDRYPDGQGLVAAQHTALGAWIARRLPPGVAVDVTEHRYAIHCCGAESAVETRGNVAQVRDLKKAQSGLSRAQRARRGHGRQAPVTGVRWGGSR